jgi:signal-transduction protein with cAMP-binding, CBS, and nucleotidyltransferase domain
LADLDTGKFFGEISLLTNLYATASVYCMNDVTCGQINEKAFHELMKKSPLIKKRFLEHLESYYDKYFTSLIAMLKNTILFKDLKRKVLR